jgi:hypothetical protein
MCEVNVVDKDVARPAVPLRTRAGPGSAVDAIAVAVAEGMEGIELTQDLDDLRASGGGQRPIGYASGSTARITPRESGRA